MRAPQGTEKQQNCHFDILTFVGHAQKSNEIVSASVGFTNAPKRLIIGSPTDERRQRHKDARTTAAWPPQAPRRRKPPRTSQIGPPAQAGRQGRHDTDKQRRTSAATTTRRTATHKRRRERKGSQPRRHKRQTSPRPGKASGMHLDNCTTPRLPPRGTNEAAEWRNADGITLGAAGTRNAPERRGGTQLPGLSRRDRQGAVTAPPKRKAPYKARRASGGLSRRPDSRTPGKAENGHEKGGRKP